MTIQFFSLLLILFISQGTFASFKATVLTRNDNMDLVKKDVIFENIDKDGRLEDSSFKIVRAKSDNAVVLSEIKDDIERMRAASVYYHLTKAKSYFNDVVQSNYVKDLEQVTVRLNITNQFSSLGHFAHDNLSPEYNNALSIPPGKGYSRFGVKPWKHEIWFRPAKKIDLPKEGVENDFEQTAAIFSEFRIQSRFASFQKFISDLFLLSGEQLSQSGLNILGSTAIIEVSFLAMKQLYGLLQGKKYLLDTSFIPEIVYHEFAHIALSDRLSLSHSSPVNEGMADFFAASIANSPRLADNVKDYAKRVREKDAFRNAEYQSQYESNAYANIDFVLGMLWKIREVGKGEGHAYIYNIRNNLTSSSSIRTDLVNAILKECRKSCKHPFRDRLKLLNTYHEMGL